MLRMNQLVGFGGGGEITADIVISTTQLNLDLLTYVKTELSIDGLSPMNLVVTNAFGNIIGSSLASLYALTIQNFAVGSTIKFINKGYIVGAGGSGGVPWGNTAGAGGPAISVLQACTFDNASGIIGGGGGGGGGAQDYGGSEDDIGGPGGAGWVVGARGGGTFSGYIVAPSLLIGGTANSVNSAIPGKGGNLGVAGTNGSGPESMGYGGAAGKAIVGNSYITWISQGDIRGTIVA